MKAGSHCMPGACPEASSTAQLVQIEVSPTHPLLLLKRALPWEAITESMTRHWREHGKNVDGGPGLPWDVSFYVPLVVLMLIKNFDSRQMEAYLAENVVARLFIGRYRDVKAQIRDHSNIARAYAALGKAGIEEVTRLVIKEAHRFGFVDEGVLSADTTAQELPMGYPNEPGILRGLAQRVGRTLTQLKTRGIQGLDYALDQVQTVLRSVKEHHLFTKGREEKREVLTRILTEVGELVAQTRPLVEALETSSDQVMQSARSRLVAMHEVIKPLMRQIVHWLTTGKVAANKIIHVGIPQARAIVRNKAGKKTEFGLGYLISRLGGGYVFGTLIAANADERQSDTGVVRLRPGWRFDPDVPETGFGGRQRCWDSTQREAALVGCRGSPGSDTQRAGSDRRGDRDTQKQSVQIQQTEGTSVADAGDGRAEVYLVVQSEQIDAGLGGIDQVGNRNTGRNWKRNEGEKNKGKEGSEAWVTSH